MISLTAGAQEIQGTLMLKGSLKTKITVNNVKSLCRLKIEKIKNLMDEDSMGNPGYQVRIKLNLDGSDLEKNLKVKVDKDITVTNMHFEGNVRKVKDFDYLNTTEKVTVKIDDEGRVLSTTFPFESQTITCKF